MNNYKLNIMNKINKLKKFFNNWYPVILAFACLLYSVTYGVLGYT